LHTKAIGYSNTRGVILCIVLGRDVPTGGVGGVAPPLFSNLQESWSKGSNAGRELATVFSVTFCFLTPPPPPSTEVFSAQHCVYVFKIQFICVQNVMYVMLDTL